MKSPHWTGSTPVVCSLKWQGPTRDQAPKHRDDPAVSARWSPVQFVNQCHLWHSSLSVQYIRYKMQKILYTIDMDIYVYIYIYILICGHAMARNSCQFFFVHGHQRWITSGTSLRFRLYPLRRWHPHQAILGQCSYASSCQCLFRPSKALDIAPVPWALPRIVDTAKILRIEMFMRTETDTSMCISIQIWI